MWKIEKIVSKGDYNYAVVSAHPNATEHGYVLQHRVVVENSLGRLLESHEVVHHKNDNKKDNRIENLEVMPRSAHAEHHAKLQGLAWCVLCCPSCGDMFERRKGDTHLQKQSNYTCCSRQCSGRLSRKIQLHGRTPEVERAISGNIVREYKKYAHDNPEETT